jgi:hypothetical protein
MTAREAIYQALGKASMCWDPRPTGVFDSEAAKKVGEELEELLGKPSLGEKVNEDTSDGYHSFKELYEFRKLYNAALFNEWAAQGKYDVHKSHRHHDGEEPFGGGWFIVTATLPTGQISNHYADEDWGLFKVPVRTRADEWDGHTAADVAKRLAEYLGSLDGATER